MLTPCDIRDSQIHDRLIAIVSSIEEDLKVAGINPRTGKEEIIVRNLEDDSLKPQVSFIDFQKGEYIEYVRQDTSSPVAGAEAQTNGEASSGPRPSFDIHKDVLTEKFWTQVAEFPMHLNCLPYRAEAEFLAALAHGSSGKSRYLLNKRTYQITIRSAVERVLEWSETIFPFSDAQTQRLLQVYQDLKSI